MYDKTRRGVEVMSWLAPILLCVLFLINVSAIERKQLHWSTKILAHDEFLDAEFEYVSRISLSPTLFALHQTM